MHKNAFVLIHFGNDLKLFEYELYFLKNLKMNTTQDIVYMYSVSDTPDIFVTEVNKIVTKSIGYDDSSTTLNAVAQSHIQFSTIRTCNFIHAYTLTEYDKICIVESDLIITKNIDSIFSLNTPSVSYFFNSGLTKVFNPKMLANNAVFKDPKWILTYCKTDSIINNGVIVDKPSLAMFETYKTNLEVVIHSKCKYPNEILFSYSNPNFYNLPNKYNLLHYNLTPQRLKNMNLNLKDVCIVHFNETKHKYLDIIKEDWIENMGNTEHNRNKQMFIMDFKTKVYDINKTEIDKILKNTPPEKEKAPSPAKAPTKAPTPEKAPSPAKKAPDRSINIGESQLKVVNTYERALNLATKYMEHLDPSNRIQYDTGNTTKIPDETKNQKWKMTMPALKNTLKYLFEKLHHSCYMLCIMNNRYIIYKLEMTDASPTFQEAIETKHKPALLKNKLITADQKKFILKEIQDPVRILQCILKKQYVSDSTKVPVKNEYVEILSDIKLPDGVFILNLTDAVILRNDGTEPFPMVTGNGSLGKYDFNEYIPILSMSGQDGYSDIPIPNYDDIGVFDDKKLLDFEEFNTDWTKKNEKKAVFRGGPSGCGYTKQTNMRVKLALMKLGNVDVELSGKGETIDSRSIKFDPVHGLGMLNTGIKPATSFLTMKDQSNHKYIIHIDGNVNAYRLLTTMRTGSLILRVESEYRSWVDHLIQPGVHYVKIKADLSDLKNRIEWCMKNDEKCKKIAQNGLDFAISVLNKEFIKSYVQTILWSLSDYETKLVPKGGTNRKTKSTRRKTHKVRDYLKKFGVSL